MLAFAVVAAMLLATLVGAFAKSYVLGMSVLICPIIWICMISRGAFADSPGECWEGSVEPHETHRKQDMASHQDRG
jgi:hypothetical protein